MNFDNELVYEYNVVNVVAGSTAPRVSPKSECCLSVIG